MLRKFIVHELAKDDATFSLQYVAEDDITQRLHHLTQYFFRSQSERLRNVIFRRRGITDKVLSLNLRLCLGQ
jgi:hypothetical protein